MKEDLKEDLFLAEVIENKVTAYGRRKDSVCT